MEAAATTDRATPDDPLVPLPTQPAGVPWPTGDWPTGPVPPGVDLAPLLDAVCTDTDRYGQTYAVVVVHRGRLVAERYQGELPRFDGPGTPVERTTPLLSWSMAKSITHAAVGILAGQGRLDPQAPAPVPAWHAEPDDPRAAILLDDLLAMRDGLDFREHYVIGEPSDVIPMLFGDGRDDVAGYAIARPAAHPPDVRFNYSSGTSNVVARIVGDAVGDRAHDGHHGANVTGFLREALFTPLGMRSATIRCDAAGTFVGSSYVYAEARDFARFGLLYLRDGTWDGHRLLPEGWVDHGRRARSVDPDDGWIHGAHWWVVGDDLGTFWANGFEGQSILCCPALDLLVVRLGRSPDHSAALRAWRAAVVDAFRASA